MARVRLPPYAKECGKRPEWSTRDKAQMRERVLSLCSHSALVWRSANELEVDRWEIHQGAQHGGK